MNAFPSRLGMYTNFKALTPISDYAYSDQQQNYKHDARLRRLHHTAAAGAT